MLVGEGMGKERKDNITDAHQRDFNLKPETGSNSVLYSLAVIFK